MAAPTYLLIMTLMTSCVTKRWHTDWLNRSDTITRERFTAETSNLVYMVHPTHLWKPIDFKENR